MFDPRKLERFLDGLEVENNFPNGMSKKMIGVPSRSPLDLKMDKYDLLKQQDKEYENVGTAEFPVLSRKLNSGAVNFWTQHMAMPLQWPSSCVTGMWSMGIDTAEPEQAAPPAKPQETPFDWLKSRINSLGDSQPFRLANPESSAPSRSPDFVHTLIAWRGWIVRNGELEALGADFIWEPKRA